MDIQKRLGTAAFSFVFSLLACSDGAPSVPAHGRGEAGASGRASAAAPAEAGRNANVPAIAGSGVVGTTAGAPGTVVPQEPPAGTCAAPKLTPLFERAAAVPPIVEMRAGGVIVTRGAGRVRGRHELEGTYSPYGERYFENRTYGFEIEDSVASGGGKVKFTYRPEAPVSEHGAQTNFRHWKIYGNGNVFHSNVTMQEVTSRELVFTVERNAREGRVMQKGDVLEFEFGIFIAGNNAQDPDPIEGRTSYYTDTFRYRVGIGGLTPENADDSGDPGPSDGARLAGATTIPWIYAEPELYFSQMALNMQPEQVQPFVVGRRLFHTDFENGQHSESGNPVWQEQAGKLGPLTSAKSCVGCHERDGRGQPPEVGQPIESMVVKLYAPAELGNQLQAQEGRAVLDRYETREVTFADGETMTLQRPIFRFEGAPGGSPGRLNGDGLAPSIRVARQIPGMGLLEAIPEADILARQDPDDCNRDGLSGRAQIVPDPAQPGVMRLGRIGWKAEKVSVAHQVADALAADMGVSTELLPEADGSVELEAGDFDDLVTYSRLLGLPARRNVDDPEVKRGEALFSSIGCVNCHAADARTGDSHPFPELRDQDIHPYSDLLLHDMGSDLADGSGTAQASEWRTPPLWGLGLLQTVSGHSRLLHDGRARSPLEAALWHGGEAAFARAGVLALDADDRAALLAFLNSL